VCVLDEFGQRNLAAAFQIFEANTGPIQAVKLFGSSDQKARYLPLVAQGRATMSIAMSEPEAGSAATDMTTRARIDGDRVVLSGVKRWCSGAGHSELYLVYARFSDSGDIGSVIIHRDDEGVSFGKRESLHGFRSIATADIHLDDVQVPVDRVLPASFADLMGAFSVERVGNATMSLATARAAFATAVRFVKERRQFGRALIDFQMVHTKLARMAAELEAAQLLILNAAASADRSVGTPEPRLASMAKLKANSTALDVTAGAMELMGGYGYHSDYEVERLHRDAHGWAVAGGTPTMQEIRIASELFGRRFPQRHSGSAS
jgi:alkylation response protein AidB-like acyl-CoA dehydrogenase